MKQSLSVALIVIGDEILNGRTTDLNGSWLSKFLFSQGLQLYSMQFICDKATQITDTLNECLKNSEIDIILTTGGLGPTLDDITKKVLADLFQKKILQSVKAKEIVLLNYARFNRVWEQSLNCYDFFPEDFVPINNPLGLAPGLLYFNESKNKLLLSAPGVPREFKAMMSEEFLPKIKDYFSNRFLENQQVVIRTHSLPEEKIWNELCPQLWKDLITFGKVSSLPHTIGIDIVVSFFGDENTKNKNQEIIKDIISKTKLKEFVWQYGNKSLPELIVETATLKKLKFGFAESCTGGLCSSKITDISGSSAVFFGSVITYDNSLKENLINVKQLTIENFGAVSIECANEMALGTKSKLNVDIAIAITGIAGPGGGTDQKPVGTVVIACASKNKIESKIYKFPGDRIKLKDRFSDMALFILYNLLCETIN